VIIWTAVVVALTSRLLDTLMSVRIKTNKILLKKDQDSVSSPL